MQPNTARCYLGMHLMHMLENAGCEAVLAERWWVLLGC